MIEFVKKWILMLRCPHTSKTVWIDDTVTGDCHYECDDCGKWTSRHNIHGVR